MKSLLTPLKNNKNKLFSSFTNRIVMAPLTRMRADPTTSIPNKLHEIYYSERANKTAFILTECTAISQDGNSFPGACGIWNNDQVKGWKNVTSAVHKVNGKIFLQIWHCGRAGHSSVLGKIPVAPTGMAIRGIKTRFAKVSVDYEKPHELTIDEIKSLVEEFRQGAKNALEAGFDGIELHGANGYLIDEFLRDAFNKRTDIYGGSIENRSRFPLEVIDSLIEVFGPSIVGIKLTPGGRLNDMFDSNPILHYTYFLNELNKRNVGFIELVETPEWRAGPNLYGINEYEQIPNVCKTFRNVFNGVIIANNGFDFETGNKIIDDGYADMVSFGRKIISNPDLVERFENNWPLTDSNEKTYYTKGEVGYIDYPRYQNQSPKPKF